MIDPFVWIFRQKKGKVALAYATARIPSPECRSSDKEYSANDQPQHDIPTLNRVNQLLPVSKG